MHAQDHHMAILAAVVALEQTDLPEEKWTQPTMRDISLYLPRINDREMQTTMKNLRRRGTLRIVTKIKVDYCSKPVGVYGLQTVDVPKNLAKWKGAMSLWAGIDQ